MTRDYSESFTETVYQPSDQTFEDSDDRRVLPPPYMPMAVARMFVSEHWLHDGLRTLRYWRGGWWECQSSHWHELEDRGIRSALYRFAENALYSNRDNKL